MRNRKVSFNLYAAWEYKKEERDLNKHSENGWQLEKGGCFHSVFIRNETERYIYQIDYKPDIEDKELYMELFSQNGWEYINSTYNGWHYFKKKWEPDMDEADEKIYSDVESLYEMENRYVRMMNVFIVLYTILAVLQLGCSIVEGFTSAKIVQLVGDVLFIYLFGVARINVNRVRKQKSQIFNIPANILFPIAFIFVIMAACIN